MSGGRGSSLRHIELRLLGGFEVRQGSETVTLPKSAQRLVALVALHGRPVQREYAAGLLWLDSPDSRAAASLRSTLWRVHRHVPSLIDARDASLGLGAEVDVDLHTAERLARGELAGEANGWDPARLACDLLPDWYDDWVTLERERFRQLRLLALDAICERHLDAGRLDRALEAGLVSLRGEPLRESTHRALIRVHLAAGNVSEALRQYVLCRRLLQEQLGIQPSQHLTRLIDDAAMTAG